MRFWHIYKNQPEAIRSALKEPAVNSGMRRHSVLPPTDGAALAWNHLGCPFRSSASSRLRIEFAPICSNGGMFKSPLWHAAWLCLPFHQQGGADLMKCFIIAVSAVTALIVTSAAAEARGFGGGGFRGGGFRGGGFHAGGFRAGGFRGGGIGGYRGGYRGGYAYRGGVGRYGGAYAYRGGYGRYVRPGYGAYGYRYRPYGYGLAAAGVGAAAAAAGYYGATSGGCGPYQYWDAYAGVCRPN
jgi:hypothetical protein